MTSAVVRREEGGWAGRAGDAQPRALATRDCARGRAHLQRHRIDGRLRRVFARRPLRSRCPSRVIREAWSCEVDDVPSMTWLELGESRMRWDVGWEHRMCIATENRVSVVRSKGPAGTLVLSTAATPTQRTCPSMAVRAACVSLLGKRLVAPCSDRARAGPLRLQEAVSSARSDRASDGSLQHVV